MAEAKALDVGSRYPDRWVVAADTIVYIDGFILGKPKNRRGGNGDATPSQRAGTLGVDRIFCPPSGKGKGDREAVQTAVKVKTLTPVEMEWYVQTGEPFDKAGGYAIQGIGVFYDRIDPWIIHQCGWPSPV